MSNEINQQLPPAVAMSTPRPVPEAPAPRVDSKSAPQSQASVEMIEASKAQSQETQEQMMARMERLAENLNEISKDMGRALSFAVEEDIDRVVIVVSNPETGEQIRKLPSDTALKIAKSIETLKGILFDETA